MAAKTLRHASISPAHPGLLLREIVIPGSGESIAGIARALGISRTNLYNILNARQPLTPAVAVRLGKLFGDGGAVWMRMQAEHDVWKAEKEGAADLAKIKTLKVA